MKKNALESFLYSIIGVIVLLLIVIAFNVVTSAFKQRIDLTKEKAYTLSEGTRAILGKIKSAITLKFYYSSSAELPANAFFLKTYAQRVQDLISEYKTASKGKLIVQQFDPKPESDAEDAARLDGIEGQQLPGGDNFYLGLCVKRLDNTEAIPFFQPDQERLLEYQISRAISRVLTPEKPVVGIMSGIPIFGTPSNPMMEQMGQRAQRPWTLVTELQNDFTVKQVDITADKIDDDVSILLVLRPTGITDKTQYAIDQFLMRGGRLAAFVDPSSILDRSSANPMLGGQMQMPGSGSTLDKLFKAWGIQFDDTKAVADMDYMHRRIRLRGNTENPAWLSITGDALNKDDVVTSEAGELWVPYSGAFTGTPVAGLKETVLVKSSKDAQLVDAMMANIAPDNMTKEFKKTGVEYPMAVRLVGKFKSAFPDGKPADTETNEASADTNKPAATASLKESKSDTAVVLVGCTDMFADDFSLDSTPTPFGNFMSPRNGNLNFAQSIIENLGGDSDLISVRSRATTSHPFTRIAEMQAKAEEKYNDVKKQFTDKVNDLNQQYAQLEQKKDASQRFILSPEQQTLKDNLQKELATARKDLKSVDKMLARDINKTENWVKWGNIIGMPLVVAISGLALAGIKRKRTSAK